MASEESSFKPGSFNLAALAIKNFDGSEVVDMRATAQIVRIYEDIHEDTMSIEIDVADGQGLFADLPLCGDEVLEIAYKTGSDDMQTINLVFNLYRVSERKPLNDRLMAYTLYGVSQEAVTDLNVGVKESFNHEVPFDIVQKIFDTHIKNASTNLDSGMSPGLPTNSVFNNVVYPTGKVLMQAGIEPAGDGQLMSWVGNGDSPFTTIRSVLNEAEGGLNKSSTFLFWETKTGFVCGTLEDLASNEVREKYIYVIKNIPPENKRMSSYREYQKVETLEIQPIFDTLDWMMDGGFGSTTKYIDPVTKQYKDVPYVYGPGFNKEKETHVDQHPIINRNLKQKYEFDEIRSNLMWSDWIQKDCKYIKKRLASKQDWRRKQNNLSKKMSWFKNFESVKCHLAVPGNSELEAGDCIDLFVPDSSGFADKQDSSDRYVDAKFIISAIRHDIDIAGEKYTTFLECIKDSFPNALQNIPKKA